MKRFFQIAFFCACALVCFVPIAKAQTDGDIVTIKSGDNFLAVNNDGTAIQNRTTENEYCYWEVTVDGDNYTFRSVTANKYLNIPTNNSNLTLGDSQNIQKNGDKLYVSMSYWWGSSTSYYISYNNGWTTTTYSSLATTLTITKVDYNPLHNLTLDSPAQGNVTIEQIKTITLSADATIGSVNENSISLTNATIDNIKVENNQLVITTKAPYADGDCVLTIEKGAVVGTDDVDFDYFEKSWTISPYTFTSVTPKTGNAGAFSVITLTADVAIKQVPTSGFKLDDTKTIGNGLTVTLSDDKKQLTITSNTILNEGTHTLSITEGAVVAEDGIAFAEATYNWTVVSHQFIEVTPAEGTTGGFDTIMLTADTDIEETLRFGYYYPENNQKIKFTHSLGSVITTSYVGSGVGVKRIDDRTLEVIIPDNLGEGTYKLTIESGAIQSSDGRNFAAATYTWTVNAHQFGTVQPATLAVGERLEQITIPAADPTVAMSIPHDPDQIADWIALTNAGGAVIPTTAAIVNNELVITPVASLGNGVYTLNVKKGAVVGPHSVPFVEASKTWNVVVSVAITHVNGFYPALGEGGYQNVHTVERTIYYHTDQTSIPLTLAETNFYGYKRWYDYTTDQGTNINWDTAPYWNGQNFQEIKSTTTTTHLGWFGWSNFKEQGVLTQSIYQNNYPTPYINVTNWTGNRTIACDLSNYVDYSITRVDGKIVGITEPRLSYRQLFHFRPASEMANKFAALKDGEYLEEYTYMAPTGTEVYLSTEFRYNGNAAENCYFYYDDGNEIKRVTNATWSGGTTKGAFRVVSSNDTGTQTYTLTADNGLRIAKFTVNYVDKNTYGPVQETGNNGSAKAIISYQEMNSKFEVLEYNDFSNGQKPTSSTAQHIATPLPWNQSTYGFYDGTSVLNQYSTSGQHTNPDGHPLPFYGEYAIVNKVDAYGSWMVESANHVDGITNESTAAQQGYALYVDGTTEPGVVASISTKVTICAARTMYCSVWLRNPRGTGACGTGVSKPIFRCDVQGRNKMSDGTYSPWENVGTYFVGNLPCDSKWQQVNFPIESEETYSECRVQIYNFGMGWNGNDFLLDDLCIYADKLPMASYQLQTEMCCSPNHDGTTFTAAVLRVDYGTTTLKDDSYQYYQIYNKTTKKPLKLTTASLSPYYHEDTQSAAPEGLTKEEYGSIKVRKHDFEPNTEEGAKICTPETLVGELLESYNTDNTKPLWGKCYVEKTEAEKQSTPGNYYMYIVHIIPNISENRIEENYLQEHCEYTLRMTNEASDLKEETLSCAVEIALPSTQESLFRLMSDQIETTEFLTQSSNNCPNEQYTIEAFIRKDSDPYSDAGKAEATYLADWMYGHAFDDVYRMDYPHANDTEEHAAKDEADAIFQTIYHCSRAQVTDAFLDLRRPDDSNANYTAKTFAEIDHTKFSDYNTQDNQKYPSKSKHYETLKYLHNQGWLQLATSSVSFYLGSQDTARYWVFPIENSAVVADGVPPLHDCPEPRWVEVNSKHSNHYVNLAPGLDIHDADNLSTDPRYGNIIPNVRVLARLVNNTIQIPIHQSSIDDYDVHFTGTDAYLFQTNDGNIANPTAVKYTCNKSGNVIVLIPATSNQATLAIGKEYTMCIRMRDVNDQHRATNDECEVGKVYVKLLILPDIVTWTPTTPDKSWHNDANWTGYGTGMQDYHYAPIAGSNVIIPTAHYPELTVIANTDEDPHPYPLDANFALTPTCGQIYFQPGAMMLNQHLLQHDKALVDLKVRNMYWNTVAVPISSIVSGDMYIPHSGDENNGTLVAESEPFTVATFQGSRHSSSAFPFWMSVYNRTVERINENPAQNGQRISTSTAAFAATNSLSHPFEVGSGYQLLGWAASNLNLDSLTVRLPKPDNVYSYYDSQGNLADNVAINRGANPNKLVYSPTTPIVLKNEITNQHFMFGNPTMAMIDMATLISERMQGATFYYMADDGWKAESATTAEITDGRYLKPMRSVLVKMPNASTEFSLNLDATYLTTPEKIKRDAAAGQGLAPRHKTGSSELQLMTIYADSYGTKARCLLGAKPGMSDVYTVGEDAIFISSGVEAEVNSATATSPVNMYTIAQQVPLMVDVRENIDTVPLALLIQDIYRTPTIAFSFELTDNWNKECYLWDSRTDEKYRIMDGLWLELDMPENHETRYFILGPDDTTNDGVSSSTNQPVFPQVDTPIQLWAYSAQSGQLQVNSNEIIQQVKVYDLTGRLVAQQALDLYGHSMTLSVPTGMCIVEATMRDNTKRRVQALVR